MAEAPPGNGPAPLDAAGDTGPRITISGKAVGDGDGDRAEFITPSQPNAHLSRRTAKRA